MTSELLTVLLVCRWVLARLRHQRFFSLEELNAAIRPLLVELNERPFQKLPGSRRSVFEALDRPAMRPLPATPYVVKFQQRNAKSHRAIWCFSTSMPGVGIGPKFLNRSCASDPIGLCRVLRALATHPNDRRW